MSKKSVLKAYKKFLDEIDTGLESLEPADEEEAKIKDNLLKTADWFREICDEEEVTEDFLTMLVQAFRLGATHNALMVAAHATVIITDLKTESIAEYVGEKKDEQVH